MDSGVAITDYEMSPHCHHIDGTIDLKSPQMLAISMALDSQCSNRCVFALTPRPQ